MAVGLSDLAPALQRIRGCDVTARMRKMTAATTALNRHCTHCSVDNVIIPTLQRGNGSIEGCWDLDEITLRSEPMSFPGPPCWCHPRCSRSRNGPHGTSDPHRKPVRDIRAGTGSPLYNPVVIALESSRFLSSNCSVHFLVHLWVKESTQLAVIFASTLSNFSTFLSYSIIQATYLHNL